MDKKYQIFISSTYKDLIEQREQVVKTVLRMGHLPVGMEMFNAADQAQWEVIKRHIDNSDYYLVILAHRYGSLDDDGVGFTEKEYDYAVSKGIPAYAFVIDHSVSWPPSLMETGDSAAKLAAFKGKVQKRLVNFWSSKESLAHQVLFSLTEAFNINPQIGWIRSNEVANNTRLTEEVLNLTEETRQLKAALALAKASQNRSNEIDDSIQYLEGQTFKLESHNGIEEIKGTHLSILRSIGTKLLSPRKVYDLRISLEESLFPESSANEKQLIEQFESFIESASMLEIIHINKEPNSNTRILTLTSKGKNILLKISSQ